MIRPKPAEDVLDDEGDGHRHDGNSVTAKNARITIHADVAGYRSLAGEAAR